MCFLFRLFSSKGLLLNDVTSVHFWYILTIWVWNLLLLFHRSLWWLGLLFLFLLELGRMQTIIISTHSLTGVLMQTTYDIFIYMYKYIVCITSSSSVPVSSLSDLGATSYLQTTREKPFRTRVSLYKPSYVSENLQARLSRHSPRVHLQPGIQLSRFGSIHSAQDLPAVHVDHLHRQVAHLTCLIQRLGEKERQQTRTCKFNSTPIPHRGKITSQ